jgi:hypothetical protein
MKKLQLKLDDIRVTGFEVVARKADGTGTVIGADAITYMTRCSNDITCEESCNTNCRRA